MYAHVSSGPSGIIHSFSLPCGGPEVLWTLHQPESCSSRVPGVAVTTAPLPLAELPSTLGAFEDRRLLDCSCCRVHACIYDGVPSMLASGMESRASLCSERGTQKCLSPGLHQTSECSSASCPRKHEHRASDNVGSDITGCRRVVPCPRLRDTSQCARWSERWSQKIPMHGDSMSQEPGQHISSDGVVLAQTWMSEGS